MHASLLLNYLRVVLHEPRVPFDTRLREYSASLSCLCRYKIDTCILILSNHVINDEQFLMAIISIVIVLNSVECFNVFKKCKNDEKVSIRRCTEI